MRRIKYLIFVGMCIWSFTLRGQSVQGVQLHTQVLPPNAYALDVFNLSVFLPSTAAGKAFVVEAALFTEQGAPLIRWRTGPITKNTGMFLLNKSSLSSYGSLQQEVFDGAFQSQLQQQGGLLPPGTYQVRYQVFGLSPSELWAEGEEVAESTSLFPPQLIGPADGDTLSQPYPVFSWSPAMGPGMSRVDYRIEIAPMLEGQSPDQALLANPTHFEKDKLSQYLLAYGAGYRKFEPNVWYAWMVSARSNGKEIARSEAWRFIYTEFEPDSCKPKPASVFFELVDEVGGDYVFVKDGQLNFQFEESYTLTREHLSFEILNVQNKVVASERSLEKPYVMGHNRFSLLICSQEVDLAQGFYTLKVKTEKGRVQWMRFYNGTEVNPCKP